MVSNLEYMSFKELDLKKQKTFNVLVATILIFIVIAYRPRIMLFFILIVYVISGPVSSLYRKKQREIPNEDTSVSGGAGDKKQLAERSGRV
jgi:CDP-diacylglycerol--serine O-phosphatidyltransferase